MSTTQRSKTGCWTCRLRRKKCNEGGPPCSNCESRGVFCHGYGPKPPWKDRGEKEREQASRLQIQARRVGRSRSKTLDGSIPSQRFSTSSGASTSNPLSSSTNVATPDVLSPLQGEFSFDSLSPSHRPNGFDFLDSLELPSSWEAPDFANNFWPSLSSAQTSGGPVAFQPPTKDLRLDSLDTSDSSNDLFPGSSSSDAFVRLANFEHQHSTNDLQLEPAICFPAGVTAQNPDAEEREIDLAMHFIEATFPLQHDSYRKAPTMQRSWLLFLLRRSPTFYYASLGMSAYHYYLSLPGENEARRVALQDYQKYRALALSGFYGILESNRPSSPSSSSILGDCMICGVQIALLEAFGKNMQESQLHLTSAARYLLSTTDSLLRNHVTSPKLRMSSIPMLLPAPTDTPSLAASPPSPMERKAFAFFRVLLVWNDILSCSVRKTASLAAEIYRKLLTEEDFAHDFREITGCESWILLSILDATSLEIWKRNLEAQGNLSIRELVSRAEKVESVLEQEISKLSTILQTYTSLTDTTSNQNSNRDRLIHIQTYIFAHSMVTHLHTIVSGSWPGVPEIQTSVDRAISAWNLLQLTSINLKTLAWPYCVSASLAVGLQRDMFRRLIAVQPSIPANASQGSSTRAAWEPSSSLAQVQAVVEECWKEYDERKSDREAACDWKEVMGRLGLSMMFAYF